MNSSLKRILITLASTAMFVSLIGCQKGSDKTDYAHNGSAKLLLDYTGRNFFQDGIGEVTVKTYIDGDTTHFLNINGDTSTILKSRYFGVDTPESTGNIQPYGKQASNFTHEKLANAAANGTIVVASPFSVNPDGSMGVYGAPEADSTGSRYLSMVWIHETMKHAPSNKLTLLNLWIVQEGLSWARIGEDEPFYDAFYKAEKQAEKLKLKIWSDKEDPYFNYGEYQTTTLKEMKDEIVEYLEDETKTHVNAYNGANVRFKGVVAGYSDRMLYVQERYILDKDGNPVPEDEYDPDHPELYQIEWAGINIFTGMSPIPEQYTDVGAYIEVVGKANDSENFGFQISDTQGKWLSDTQEGEDYCRLILTSEENVGEHALETFEYSKADLNRVVAEHNYESLYCRTKVTEELVCTSCFVNAAGTELTLNFEGCDFTVYAPFLYRGNPDDLTDTWMHPDNVVGKTFQVSGVFGYHLSQSGNLTYQLIACNESDLVCLTPKEGTVTAQQYTVSEAVSHASEAIPNVHYYTIGKVSTLEEIDSTAYDEYTSSYQSISIKEALALIANMKDGATSSKIYCLKGEITSVEYEWDNETASGSYVISEKDPDDPSKENKITLYYVGVDNDVVGSSLGLGSQVIVEGRLKRYAKDSSYVAEVTNGKVVAHYSERVRSFTLIENMAIIHVENGRIEEGVNMKNIAVGSTFSIIGVPSVEDNLVYYRNVRILAAFAHGQYVKDPLTLKDANDMTEELETSARTDSSYYMIGTVKEINYEYDSLPTVWHDNKNKYSADKEGKTGRICFTIEQGDYEYLIWGAKMDIIGYEEDEKTPIFVDYTLIVPGALVLVNAKLTNNSDGVYSTYYNGCKVISIFN